MKTCNTFIIFAFIALGVLCFSTSFIPKTYGENRNYTAKQCEELLDFFQNKMSRGLIRELRSMRGSKKLTAYLLTTQNDLHHSKSPQAEPPQVINLPLKNRLSHLEIELLQQHNLVAGGTYLEIRGTKKSILALIDDLKTRETRNKASEIVWIGLRKKPTQASSKAETIHTINYPQASIELKETLNSRSIADTKAIEVSFYISTTSRSMPKRKKPLDTDLSPFQSVVNILQDFAFQGLVIQEKYEELGMIVVRAPAGLLRNILSQEIENVNQVTLFNINMDMELIHPVDVRPNK